MALLSLAFSPLGKDNAPEQPYTKVIAEKEEGEAKEHINPGSRGYGSQPAARQNKEKEHINPGNPGNTANPGNAAGPSKENSGIASEKETGGNSTEKETGGKAPGLFVPPERGYWIEVLVEKQKVRIYKDGQLEKEWLASTGTPDKPTPLAVFAIQNRGEWFFNPKYNQGAKWWVSFKDWGIYLFHSLPMDRNQQIIPEEAAKLGTPASHGCVRLEVDNAKWIYDHIPQGTPVYIH
jgi:lipoprotein-anchoring transpeptidase ErfK/SrfK